MELTRLAAGGAGTCVWLKRSCAVHIVCQPHAGYVASELGQIRGGALRPRVPTRGTVK